MTSIVQQALKQETPFTSVEQEVFLGLQLAAHRTLTPWADHLRIAANLSPSQYNVLRILRGVHPDAVACGEISERMISREPDMTRLLDRLAKRNLVIRERGSDDRRVVRVRITEGGLEMLSALDQAAREMPRHVLGSIGAGQLRSLADLLGTVIERADAHSRLA